MKIDKYKLLHDCLVKEKKEMIDSIEKITISRDESPLPNDTRSDTSRIQADNMLTALKGKLKALDNLLSELPKNINDEGSKAGVWSYTELVSDNFKIKLILVPEGYGGREVGEIKTVSMSTPLAEAIIDKFRGETVIINGNKMLITFLL